MVNKALLFFFCVQSICCLPDIAIENTISDLFRSFKRDFTVLDLTGDQKSAERLVRFNENCDFCYVMFGSKNKFNLRHDKVIALNNRINKYCFSRLLNDPVSVCMEDFDVVIIPGLLALNNYYNLDCIAKLGWFTIFITSDVAENRLIDKLKNLPGVNIVSISNHMILATRGAEKFLKKATNLHDMIVFRSLNSFDRKVLFKATNKLEWHKGINLITYVQLDGFWPTLDMLVREIHHNFTLEHGDFHPWNLIVQGAKMYAIDGVEQHTLPDIKHRIACLKSTIYWVCTVMNHRNPAEKSSNTVHVIKRWLQLSVQHVLSERTFNYSGLTAPGLVW